MDPKETLELAQQLRAQADDLEEQAFRAALEQCCWLEQAAARMLGIPRQSMQTKLAKGRPALRELGAEAARRRKAEGHEHGQRLSDLTRRK